MKKILSAAAALTVFLLLLCACASYAEEWDPMVWRKDCLFNVESLYFDDPHVGVPMPVRKGWKNKSRKEIPAGKYANAWQLTGSGLSDGVPVELEYTLYLRKDDGPADPEAELRDWIAQYGGENGSYYFDGRPGAYSLHATEDGQGWEACHRILFDKLILDVRVAWGTPDRPAVGREEILGLVSEITIRGWFATLTDYAEKLMIRCPGMVYAGQTLQCYALNDCKEDITDDVLWSAEGAEIDEHGFVTLYPDTKEGDSLTVTAELKDGGASVSKTVAVTRNALETIRWKLLSPGAATQLLLPAPDTEDLSKHGPYLNPIYDSNATAEYILNTGATLDSLSVSINYRIEIWKKLPKTNKDCVKKLKSWAAETGGTPEYFYMNGWPGAYTVTDDTEGGSYSGRTVHYRLIFDHRSSSRGCFDIDITFWLTDEKALPVIDRKQALEWISAIRVKDEPVVITDALTP